MLQENKIQENEYVEKMLTDDGRKKEKHVKEEKVGEETHVSIEFFEEIPLKLKNKIIERKKNFELIYERETITYDFETGEMVGSSVEKIDLPKLKKIPSRKEEVNNYLEENSDTNNYLEENSEIKNIIKNIEKNSKIKNNTKNILDKILIAVVIAQICYLLYYFIR
jgi:hypothetical protein